MYQQNAQDVELRNHRDGMDADQEAQTGELSAHYEALER